MINTISPDPRLLCPIKELKKKSVCKKLAERTKCIGKKRKYEEIDAQTNNSDIMEKFTPNHFQIFCLLKALDEGIFSRNSFVGSNLIKDRAMKTVETTGDIVMKRTVSWMRKDVISMLRASNKRKHPKEKKTTYQRKNVRNKNKNILVRLSDLLICLA